MANPNRPTVSNPADITQFGVLEMEYGVDVNSEAYDFSGLLKFTVARDLELRFTNTPFERDRSSGNNGFGDLTAGFQFRFLHQSDAVPSMAVAYGLKFPTAKQGLGSGQYDHDLNWLVSKDIAQVHVDFNLDFQFLGREGASGFDRVVAPALAVSYPLPHELTVAAEISGTSYRNRGEPATASFLLALSYALRPRLVFDSAISFGLTDGTPGWTYLGGFTYSIADLYHRK